jgi:hypothetical protein
MQYRPNDSPYVAFMVLNVEKLPNQERHALGSPQIVGPTMCFRTLTEQVFQFMKLRFLQLARRAGMRHDN